MTYDVKPTSDWSIVLDSAQGGIRDVTCVSLVGTRRRLWAPLSHSLHHAAGLHPTE